jgi:hypothetical protein
METIHLQAVTDFTQDEGMPTPSEDKDEWILRNIVAPNIK